MTQIITGSLAIVLYLITSVLLGKRLFRDRTQPSESTLLGKNQILSIGLVGMVFHAICLYQNLFVPGGLDIGLVNAISLITWIIALLILLASFSNPTENLGVFLLPVAGIAVFADLLFDTKHTMGVSEALELKLHILMSVMAYSLLSIAAVHAILLAIQDRHLRTKRPGGFIRALPPLQTMETLLFQMIGLGLMLLSLSLLSGIIYIDDMFAQHLVHKTILSIVAWVVFAILLWGRWRFGWRGSIAIRWTLSGFVVLLLAYIGSKGVTEIILGH
jgi:ABC-type uncharacterized transport system permease subunit